MGKDVAKIEFEQLMKTIQKYEVLSREEEIRLFDLYHSGDTNARQRLINCNLRLVASNALDFSKDYEIISTLFQEGVFGLIRAIEKYDETYNLKFSTYATPWIRQSIYRYIVNDNLKKIPEWMCVLARRIKTYSYSYYSKNGIQPTDDYLSKHFNTSIKNIIIAKNVLKIPLSINTALTVNSSESDICIEIPDKINIENEALNNIVREEIYDLLNNVLNDDEKLVIINRFGLINNHCLSVQETAEATDLSSNRVITCERNALRKIRKSDVKRLKGYLS